MLTIYHLNVLKVLKLLVDPKPLFLFVLRLYLNTPSQICLKFVSNEGLRGDIGFLLMAEYR